MVPSEAVMTIISLKAWCQSAKGPVRSRLQMIGPPVNPGVMEATHSHAIRKVILGRALAQTHTFP